MHTGAANGKETQDAFESGIHGDVLISDIKMPVMNGYETAEWMKQHMPEVRVMLYSMNSNISEHLLPAMGVRGLVNKSAPIK